MFPVFKTLLAIFWFLKIQYKIEHQLSNFFKRVRLDFDENNVMSVDELRKLSNCQCCLLILGSAIFQFNYYISEHVLWFKTIFLIFWFYLFCFWDRVTPCSQADLKLWPFCSLRCWDCRHVALLLSLINATSISVSVWLSAGAWAIYPWPYPKEECFLLPQWANSSSVKSGA